jgi:DNA-directed RNA polymerase subunit L
MSKNNGKFDISVKVRSYTPIKDYKSSNLCVEFKGKDMYFKLINTISRVACSYLPTYAFAPQLINITENTCIAYDNQYLQLRLSNLPIYNVDLDIYHLHDKYWKNVNYNDINREKHPSEKDIRIYINANNNTKDIKYVTTNDIEMYIDSELKNNMYNKKNPILLIKLRPGDSFKCDMTAVLGVGESHTIWRNAVNSYAPYEDDKCVLYIHSNGQESEYVILIKSCKHILKRLEDIRKVIEDKVSKQEIKNIEYLNLIIDGEEHTMGEIINYEFQSHPNLISGFSKPDLLIKSASFKICAQDPSKMIKSIYESIDSLISKYNYILNLVEKLK